MLFIFNKLFYIELTLKTVVFHDAMRLTTPRKRVDWD